MPERFYLDYAATTPLRPDIFAAMEPHMAGAFGNPSSLHADGRLAKGAIDKAREQISKAIGCEFGEVIFTSGASEAALLAIVGYALANSDPRRNRIFFNSIEHHCVLQTRPILERLGYSVNFVPVDRFARVDFEWLEENMADDVLLLAVMHTNNEVGSRQPAERLAELAKKYGAGYYCDAVQSFGRFHTGKLQADLISISSHKIGGPKGAGALFVRAGTKLKPVLPGGSQERELRGGTENVPGIVGFGAAAELFDPQQSPARARAQFKQMLSGLPTRFTLPESAENHPGILHLRVPGLDAETALIRLDLEGISASSGSACSSGSLEPSHVLTAMGFSPVEAKQGLRFSFSPELTMTEAANAGERTSRTLQNLLDRRASRVGSG